MRALSTYFYVLYCIASALTVYGFDGPTQKEQELIDHATSHGAFVGFTVGRACNGCLRGSLATRDYAQGEMVFSLPMQLAIQMASVERRPGSAAEYAYYLAIDLTQNHKFKEQHRLYFDTLPDQNGVFNADMFEEHHLDLIGPGSNLEDAVLTSVTKVEGVYYGMLPHMKDLKPLGDVLKDDTPSLNEFKHLSALVGTRDFGIRPRGRKAPRISKTSGTFLLPISDLVNHSDDPNLRRFENGTHHGYTASRSIKKGEEVTHMYMHGKLFRDDMSLLLYGFIQNKPYLWASDLPTYNRTRVHAPTPLDDAVFYGPNGTHRTRAEYDRLAGLLYDTPSTDDIDRALLWSMHWWGKPIYWLRCHTKFATSWLGVCPADLPKLEWQEEMLIKMRMHRRKMLRATMKGIKEYLDAEEEAALGPWPPLNENDGDDKQEDEDPYEVTYDDVASEL